MEKSTERWIKLGPSSENHDTFLNFQKRTGDAPPLPPPCPPPPPPSCVPDKMVFLNYSSITFYLERLKKRYHLVLQVFILYYKS